MKFILLSIALLSIVSCQRTFNDPYLYYYTQSVSSSSPIKNRTDHLVSTVLAYDPTSWYNPTFTSDSFFYPNDSSFSTYDSYLSYGSDLTFINNVGDFGYYSVDPSLIILRKKKDDAIASQSSNVKQETASNTVIMNMAPIQEEIEALKLVVFNDKKKDMSEYRSLINSLDLTQVNNQIIAKILLLEELLASYISKKADISSTNSSEKTNGKGDFPGNDNTVSKSKNRKMLTKTQYASSNSAKNVIKK